MGTKQSVRLVLHVGPRKTGSSSLQVLLGRHRDLLTQHGVFVPPGVNEEFPGHHMVPYRLLGRTVKTLGGADTEDLAALFSTWLVAATKNDCGVIVVSAEDLSIMSEMAWRELGQILTEAQALSGVSVSSLDLVVVERNREARARSGANELVKHGATAPIPRLVKRIEQDDKIFDKIMGKLPRMFPLPTVMIHVQFDGDNLMGRWIAQVLGESIAETLPPTAFDVMINPAMADTTIEQLRKFNELNSPGDPTQAALGLPSPETEEEIRAFRRLSIVRWVFAERDSYYNEMNRLAARVHELEAK